MQSACGVPICSRAVRFGAENAEACHCELKTDGVLPLLTITGEAGLQIELNRRSVIIQNDGNAALWSSLNLVRMHRAADG